MYASAATTGRAGSAPLLALIGFVDEAQCPVCNRLCALEAPTCANDHGSECPERLCTECGAALFVHGSLSLDVGSLDVGSLDVGGLDVGGLDVGGLDVDGLDVDGLDVDGLDVDGLDVDGLDVDGLDVDGLDLSGESGATGRAA